MVNASSRRVAVVTGLPTPYREPLFERMSEENSIQLRVFYCAEGHGDVGWRGGDVAPSPSRVFLRNWTPAPLRRLPCVGYMQPELWKRLQEFDPEYVIVYGYNQITQWTAYAYCLRKGIPFAIRGDSNALIDDSTSWRSRVRRRVVRGLVTRAHAVLPIGSANREFWIRHGARREQIFDAPYAVDRDRIAAAADVRTKAPLGKVRFLYVGRLIARKRVDLLLSAFNRVVASRHATLTIIGDGPERSKLQEIQSDAAWNATRWVGKVDNDQVCRWYSRGDVLVMPGWREPWGMVVQEAACAGLAVIADGRVGSVQDLFAAEHPAGAGGWVLNPIRNASLESAMLECAANPEEVARRGRAARERASSWTYDRTVDGILQAVHSVRPSLSSRPVAALTAAWRGAA